jgi:hypothetical protein
MNVQFNTKYIRISVLHMSVYAPYYGETHFMNMEIIYNALTYNMRPACIWLKSIGLIFKIVKNNPCMNISCLYYIDIIVNN